MKKNIQNKQGELKKNLVALLSSNKLKAAILAPMALSLVACGNVSGGSDDTPIIQPPPAENPEDPTKEVSSRDLNTLSATHNGSSAKNLNDILNNTTFNINYDITYTDNTVDNNKTATVDKSRLEEFFNGVVSFSFNGDFSETNQTVDLIIKYNDKQFTIPGIKNGNYKSQEGQQPSIKDVTALLKEILTEKEYNRISGELSSGNITLTAQTIKAVGDNFSVLENNVKNGSTPDSTIKGNITKNDETKKAFVAQNEGKINITKSGSYTLNSYNVSVIFNGEFNLDEITLPANNGKGNFSNATLKNSAYDISIDEFNDIRGSSFPTISSTNISSISSPKAIYDLYKAYSSNLDKLTLKGNLTYTNIDGKEISGRSDYTLFTNDNKAKLSTDTSIISLSADALAQMYTQLKIYNIRNMIISGNAKANTVNWRLVNIVFEGDMSKLINEFTDPDSELALPLYGVIYFKDKPYNNSRQDGQSVKGMIKLDNLQGVSNENFKVGFASSVNNVLDVSGISTTVLDSYVLDYDKQIASKGGTIHAIYFNENYTSANENKIKELCEKFANPDRTGAINVYLGNKKVQGNKYDKYPTETGASKTPRTLKEFEYFGNLYDAVLYGDTKMQFKESAKSSYTDTEFKNLPSNEQNKLTNDDSKKQIAQNNKRIEFIDPETQKIIFSVVNDRQYNA